MDELKKTSGDEGITIGQERSLQGSTMPIRVAPGIGPVRLIRHQLTILNKIKDMGARQRCAPLRGCVEPYATSASFIKEKDFKIFCFIYFNTEMVLPVRQYYFF